LRTTPDRVTRGVEQHAISTAKPCKQSGSTDLAEPSADASG